MKVEMMKISELKTDPKNVRKHDSRNINAIKRSLEKFGTQKPLVIDADNVVVAGNGTLQAAKGLGWKEIAVVRSSLTGLDRAAFAVADNKTTDLSEFDFNELAEMLRGMEKQEYDLDVMGFEDWELEPLLQSEYKPPKVKTPKEEDEGGDGGPTGEEEEPGNSETQLLGQVHQVMFTKEQYETVRAVAMKMAEPDGIQDADAIIVACSDWLEAHSG